MHSLFNPPHAKKRPHPISFQGRTWDDPYFWLREREKPEVLEYLQAENAYTETVMKDTAALQEKLYQEMLARIQETDLTVPVRRADYFYYTRTEKGKQYSIYCRRVILRPQAEESREIFRSAQQSFRIAQDDAGEEEILLDQNELARGHEYFRLGVFRVSPDQNLLAYSTDTSGAEEYTLAVKDLFSGKNFSFHTHAVAVCLILDQVIDRSPVCSGRKRGGSRAEPAAPAAYDQLRSWSRSGIDRTRLPVAA